MLKENGVVDAGGFGLAILIEGFVAAALGEQVVIADVSSAAAPILTVEPVDDWDDDEYLYCTEFLLFGDGIDSEAVHDFVSSVGGSELVVGSGGEYKVHVHTNEPGKVLAHMTSIGEVAEVHIHNMRRQTQDRDAGLAGEHAQPAAALPATSSRSASSPSRQVTGLAEILTSLGVDVVVSGGQTMNPSTQDLADAIARRPRREGHRPAEQQEHRHGRPGGRVGCDQAGRRWSPRPPCPQAFSALLAYDGSTDDLDGIAEAMTEAAEYGPQRRGHHGGQGREGQGRRHQGRTGHRDLRPRDRGRRR